MKFIAQIIGKWRSAGLGFKTAQINWFDNRHSNQAGDALPLSDKVRESEGQFAWIVEYDKQ